MKRLLFVLALLFAFGNVYADSEGTLADKLFAPENVPLKLTASGLTASGKPSQDGASAGFWAAKNPEDLNPGKALLLSAILPGAGELYAGNRLKAAIFFGIEVAAWTGVIYFYGQGKDKEDEFMDFADDHFSDEIYWTYEFTLALDDRYGDGKGEKSGEIDPDANRNQYPGTLEEWINDDWNEKIHYLPDKGFTHELPTRDEREDDWSLEQQFYEMIGKYIHQFGVGWDDTPDYDPTNLDPRFKPYFDGTSLMSKDYMDLRYDSNKLLEYSAWGYNIALLNHVVSALDASFSVKLAKRRAKAEVSFRQVPYDRELVNAAGLKFTW